MGHICLRNVSLNYGKVQVIEALNLDIPQGNLIALVGPNGAGKSTFLKALAGVLKPHRGTISMGCDEVAYLPQQSDIDRSFPITLYQFVAMGLWRKIGSFGGLSKSDHTAIDVALHNVGLGGFGSKSLASLSGGQLQRVLFARLSLQNASVILLDEPFNAIDTNTVSDLMQSLTLWQSEQRTIIAVLHDLDLVKDQFPCTLMIAHDVVGFGKTTEVLTSQNLKKARQLCDAFDRNSLMGSPAKKRIAK